MTLQLDARQRAMLQEMGIRLFWPETAPAPVRAPVAAAAPVAAPVVARDEPPPASAPARRPPALVAVPLQARPPAPEPEAPPRLRDAAVESLDWDGLRQAVVDQCEGRRSVFGSGDLQPDLLVIGDPPSEQEESAGEPFVGDAGTLLDNMLAALGLSRQRRVYLTNVLKCRPAGGRNPEADEIAQAEPVLRRQVQLLRPKVIVVMGRFAAPALLQANEPLGRLRGRLHRYEGVPTVVTYPPAYLLRTLPDKAKAWADLCLAQSVLRDAS